MDPVNNDPVRPAHMYPVKTGICSTSGSLTLTGNTNPRLIFAFEKSVSTTGHI